MSGWEEVNDIETSDITALDSIRPLGGLPAADRTLLIKPPLELVIAEVRFVPSVAMITDEQVLAVQRFVQASGFVMPQLQPAQEASVEVSVVAGQPTTTQQFSRGWQLTASDPRTHAIVMPGALVIQTAVYERWSVSLKPLLSVFLDAIAATLAPTIGQRVGLRYVDRFTDSQARSAASWRARIVDELLGPACHDIFGHLVVGAQQQLQLQFEPGKGALLRHGPFGDNGMSGAVSYLLDIDVFDETSHAFDPDDLMQRAEVLNRTALSLFQNALTPDYLLSMQVDASPI